MSLRPIIVRTDEGLTLPEAAALLDRSERTLRRWNEQHRIARRISNARLLLSYPALLMLAHEDIEALEILRAGERTHPRVRPYLEACGILVA